MAFSQQKLHVIIVGGGVFGVTAAIELKKRNYAVTVIDPEPLPNERASSTDISKLIRADYGSDEFYMELMEECFKIWKEWNIEWGEELYHEDGVLAISRAWKEGSFIVNNFYNLKKRGFPIERLTKAMIRQRYPAWNTEIWSEGYFNKRGGWAESGRVVAKLAQKAIQNGVRLLIGTVQQLIIEIVDIKNTQRVKGVLLESGESIYGDFVIVAAGAWTPILLPHLRTVMTPKAQPIFHFGLVDSLLQSGVISKKTFPPFLADISETGFYGFCPHPTDGRIKLGHHGRGYPMEILTKEAVAKKWEEVKEFETRKFRDFLEDAFPQTLAKAPVVYTRLCFYCDTLDGDFWIDHDPKVAGLVVAAGGSGHGFKFAPMLGSIIADVLEKKPNKFAYRFRWRVPDPSRGEESRYRFAESYKNQLSHITPNQKTLSSSTIVSSRHSSLQFVQPKL